MAAKQANVTEKVLERSPHAGDCWTWVAIDADTKLVCTWLVGKRDWVTAKTFIDDLQIRLTNRVQITTDGLKLYLQAINLAFGTEVDYAVLMKLYGGSVTETKTETRYSPAKCIGCEKTPKIGNPDNRHISTSYVEGLQFSVPSFLPFLLLITAIYFAVKRENRSEP